MLGSSAGSQGRDGHTAPIFKIYVLPALAKHSKFILNYKLF